MAEYCYRSIKKLGKEMGLSVKDLLVLSTNNDPFYVGMPAQITNARWFADVWERFGYTTGVHLRRVHYALISQMPLIKLPTTLSWTNKETETKQYTDEYINEDRCWTWLENASKYARYLGLVDPDAFIDRRNPDAQIFANWDVWDDPEPDYAVVEGQYSGGEYYGLPGLPDLPGIPDIPHLVA